MASARAPSAPPPVAAYSVQRLPLRGLRPPWGLPDWIHLHTSVHRRRRSCAWPAFGVSGPEVPLSPWESPKGPTQGKDGSPGVLLPTTRSNQTGPVHPGIPLPGTFRPQGFILTLSTVCSLPGLAPARQPAQRPWDSPFKALLLPTGATPLGASPLLSFLRLRFRGDGRDFRGCLRTGRGTKAATEATTAGPCLPGFWPLQGVLLHLPWNRLPGSSPSRLFDRKCSLRFHFRARPQGF